MFLCINKVINSKSEISDVLKTSDFFVLLLLIKMVFSYEDKVRIKYIRTMFGHSARRIVTDHPEYDWNEHGVNR